MIREAVRSLADEPVDAPTAASLEAEAIYTDALQRASSHEMVVVDLIGSAEKLTASGRHEQAVALYRVWIKANTDHPLLWAVYFNYGVVLAGVDDLPAAALALRAAIELNPSFCPPYINLGSLLERQGFPDQAVAQWMVLAAMFPTVTGNSVQYKTMALNQMARVLQLSGKGPEAEEMLRQSAEINPEQSEVIEHLIALRQGQCKWPIIVPSERVTSRRLVGAMPPLSLASYTEDAMFQLARAYRFNRYPVRTPKAQDLVQRIPATRGESRKLRIGYVSSDLRAHAVGFAMTDVLETHDRDRFEIFAYYCGVAWEDDTKARIRKSVDHWIDINDLDDQSAAARIAEDRIDILIDLNGYSKDARTKIFAMRPAPIAVNWFGFPGTMGSSYHHYLIADDYIIPPSHEIYYSEKVLRLPCYQPNDRRRVIAANCPTRLEAGLPESGFVYCCLNGMQKLTELTFKRWMAILRQVPGSVLWLLKGSDLSNERLREVAAQEDVAPERIVFADRTTNPEHVARYALADLFLDTLPYGAHTTAADSLWMGVPILTLSGRTFASRVCGSVLRAAGLPELICSSTDDYIARAVVLGRDKTRVAAMKQHLLDTRKTSLLFDTPMLIASLEALYRQIWDAFIRGDRPVPDLRNLDLYHEIGVDLDLETIELLNEDDYQAVYRQKLTEMNSLARIEPDARLWSAHCLAVAPEELQPEGYHESIRIIK